MNAGLLPSPLSSNLHAPWHVYSQLAHSLCTFRIPAPTSRLPAMLFRCFQFGKTPSTLLFRHVPLCICDTFFGNSGYFIDALTNTFLISTLSLCPPNHQCTSTICLTSTPWFYLPTTKHLHRPRPPAPYNQYRSALTAGKQTHLKSPPMIRLMRGISSWPQGYPVFGVEVDCVWKQANCSVYVSGIINRSTAEIGKICKYQHLGIRVRILSLARW